MSTQTSSSNTLLPLHLATKSRSLFAVRKFAVGLHGLELMSVTGPPPQVASVAGKKDGPRQGELGGILKELGYASDQVGFIHKLNDVFLMLCSRSTSSEGRVGNEYVHL